MPSANQYGDVQTRDAVAPSAKQTH